MSSGRLSLNQLIQEPWVIGAIFVALFFPFAGAFIHLHTEQNQLTALSEQISRMPLKMHRALEKQRERQIFVKRHGAVQEDYLEHAFKEIVFLGSEVQALQELEQMPVFASCTVVKERLAHLTSLENKLTFREVSQRNVGEMRERIWKQCHPVEIDHDDLEALLIKIEKEIAPDKPQLVISIFHLKRNQIKGRESYTLDMEIIERSLNPSE